MRVDLAYIGEGEVMIMKDIWSIDFSGLSALGSGKRKEY